MKVMGEATHQRFRKLEGDIAEVKTAVQNLTGTVEQVESQGDEIQDLRARLITIEKAEANRQADSERVRHEQRQTLNEMKQLAEQAKTVAY